MKQKVLFKIRNFASVSLKHLLTACMLLFVLQTQAQVVINEVMTKNISTIKDDDGDYSNFIELYNAGTTTVDLNGYGLTNDSNTPNKWVFGNKTLAAGEYFRVWASAKDRGDTPTPASTLIPFASTWKYLDNGSNQGTAWSGSAFDDTSWKSGQAMLGYPATASPNVTTVVSFGSNSKSKYRCTYFRKTINIADKNSVGALTLSINIDDGAVVYVNGTEVMRKNMPTGTITNTTFANVTVGSIANFTETIPSSLLVDGDNVIAVQVHQSTASSSDLRFDLELKASGSQAHTNFTIADGDVISLFMPNGVDNTTTPAIQTQNDLSFGRFPNGSENWRYLLTVTPGAANATPALTSLPGVSINEIMVRNTSAVKNDKGNYSSWVELYNLSNQSMDLSGYKLSNDINNLNKWSFQNFNVASKQFKTIWLSGANQQATQGGMLVSAGAVWKYKDDGSDQGTAWTGLSFDDAAWAQGPAELGYGDGDEATAINAGTSGARFPCNYFRYKFSVTDKSSIGRLKISLIRDDGAVVYINGQEVVRDNMPEGVIDYLTWAASPEVAGAAESTWFDHIVDGSILNEGENIISVSVHQQRAASSDISFNFKMENLGVDAHTDFALTAGQTLYLSNESSEIVSQLTVPSNIPDNASYGISPDGYGDNKYFMTSTPNASNGNNGVDNLPNPKVMVLNPYTNVDWKTVNHFKTNIHTHTNNSDGSVLAHIVVDNYATAGYKILSITDHNLITYPWTNFSAIKSTYENRNPQILGMLDIAGNELSGAHHSGSYVNVVAGSGSDLNAAFSQMATIGGIGSFKHPGRYWSISTTYAANAQYSIDWYQNFYATYPALVSMEVYNQGDRYPNDRVLWDELLTRMMPERPIWGQSSDDMHSLTHLFKNYDYRLMPELTTDGFKSSMQQGTSYFVYEPSGNGTPQVASLDSVKINKTNRTITIHANNYTSIEWISGVQGTGSGRTSNVIATGATFSYNNMTFPYVRAVITNAKGKVFTQPFGFAERMPNQISQIVGEVNFCSGTTAAVYSIEKDEAAEQYNWVLPQGAIIVSGAGTNSIVVDMSGVTSNGTIQVSKSNLLGSSNVVSLNLVLVNRPTKPIVTENGSVLRSDATTGNQWYNQDGIIQGATEQELNVSGNGQYYVVVNTTGCDSEPSSIINVTLISTDKNDLETNSIKIYPNPVANFLTIENLSSESHLEYVIVNNIGQVVLKGQLQGHTKIDTEGLAMGTYIVRTSNGKSIMFSKVK